MVPTGACNWKAKLFRYLNWKDVPLTSTNETEIDTIWKSTSNKVANYPVISGKPRDKFKVTW